MVPDSALIAEIILFAAGFSNSKAFAKKVDSVHRLASLQLSKQDHFDFGLRALTSCLKLAERKKRADTDMADEMVLFSALKETVLPKLPQADIPVYMGILGDLFPGVEAPLIEDQALKAAVREAMVDLKLQPTDSMISKILQLNATKASRHGVMMIGESGSGKTTAVGCAVIFVQFELRTCYYSHIDSVESSTGSS